MRARQMLEDPLPGAGRDGHEGDMPHGQLGQRKPKTPEGWKQIPLRDIFAVLPKDLVRQIIQELKTCTDSIETTKRLKTLLAPHAKALEVVGLIPDFFAYALIYYVLPRFRQENR
jgi:hypothetical protein